MSASNLTSTSLTGARVHEQNKEAAVRQMRSIMSGWNRHRFPESLGISLKPADDLQSCSRAGSDPYCPPPGDT